MSGFSGTKGPWEVFKNDGEDMVIQAGSLERGGGWIGYTCIAAEFQNEKDATLIAAAPELLEALQACEKILSEIPLTVDLVEDLLFARSAIAKALGQ
jgi:hypothetical protein